MSIIDNLRNKIYENPKILILSFILVIIFYSLSYILYKKYIKSYIDRNYVDNREFLPKSKKNNITVIYFYTEWCPACKRSKPEWNKFKELVNINSFNKEIILKEIDCDKETTIANNYNIEGYPTIKLIYNNKIYDYDANPQADILLEFLQSTIHNN